MGGISPVKA